MKPTSVDAYIAQCPKEFRSRLQSLRKLILTAVPASEEKMSYGMPYYGYKGRLAYFALAKHHIGLYIPPPIIAEYAEDLKKYVTSVSAVQFPLDQELPTELIKKLILARKQFNEAQVTQKK